MCPACPCMQFSSSQHDCTSNQHCTCTVCPVPCHCTLCPISCAMCPVPSTLCPAPCLRPAPCALYPVPCTLHPVPCAMYLVPSALCPVPGALCYLPCPMSHVPCALRAMCHVPCTPLYPVSCTLCHVPCTLYLVCPGTWNRDCGLGFGAACMQHALSNSLAAESQGVKQNKEVRQRILGSVSISAGSLFPMHATAAAMPRC